VAGSLCTRQSERLATILLPNCFPCDSAAIRRPRAEALERSNSRETLAHVAEPQFFNRVVLFL
jgi:hypothetical protein